MKKSYYFSHDFNARNDEKLQKLQFKHGMAGIGIFRCIIEMLYEQQGYIEEDYESISFVLREGYDRITDVIQNFGLFMIENGKISSKTVIERLEKMENKVKQSKEAIKSRRDKHRGEQVTNTVVLPAYYGNDTTVIPIKENKIKENKIKENKQEKNENLEKFISDWNGIENGKSKKMFPSVIKITPLLIKTRNEKLKTYTEREIRDACNNYQAEIKKRKDDGSGYIEHRFTLLEFLTQKNGLEKFINYQ